jgi:zinc protease
MSAKQKEVAATTATTATIPDIKFEKYLLPNGLQVILHVDRKLPIVHVNQWYHVGSKNEKRGRTGFAHLFEHVMFQGSRNAPDDYFAFVERAGANVREGGVNGTTSNDRTNYFATVPSGNLEFLLWLESDRLATLTDALTQQKLDNQREVVRNERRQSVENVPYGRWHLLATEHLHPPDHPYSWPVIGSHEDLMAASLEDVIGFFKQFYTPNNLTLVIAGHFDPAEAKTLVAKYYGDIPPGPALDRPARYVPVLTSERIVEVSDRVPQERTYFVWPSPPYFERGEAELDVASIILSDGLSSRFNKVLVYDKQLASNVTSFNWANEIGGAFVVVATARPDAPLAQIEAIISEEIARLASTGPTSAELDRARTKWEYEFVSGLERIGGFGGKADRLAQYNVFLRDPDKLSEDFARYRDLTAADVGQAVRRWLDTPNRLLLRFHPEASTRRAAESKIDRERPPELGADRLFLAPEVKSTKLSNGIDLLVVERSELPKVAVSVATRAGTIADPPGKEGLAHLIVTTIDMGTSTRNALEIEDVLGDLGTSLSGFASREYSLLSLEVLKRNLASALEIFAEVVRDAQFPSEEVEREKKRHLDALAQQSNNPTAVAARIRPMLAFGPDHPYGRPAQGLPSTINNIARDDIVGFHRTYWKPASSALIFVGDVTLDEAKQLAESSFGVWSGGTVPKIQIPPPAPAKPGKVYLVDRADAAQTIVMQILPGPSRKVEDYYTFRLVDAVWGGGGFGTRLNLNLREDKGYSYGVFSSIGVLSEVGSWWASGGVQTDKTSESIVEFVDELKHLIGNKPISEAELTGAKERRVRGYAQQFESLGRIASQIADLWALGLPMTELQRELDETSRATLEAVGMATKRYVDPSRAVLLLVGDRAKIEPGIRSLGVGEIVVLDAEGRPIREARSEPG